MSIRRAALAAAAWLLLLAGAAGAASVKPPLAYPETRRDTVVDTLFGERVADPYRWLENDVRSDPEVADWVGRENALTHAYLNTLPERGWFEARIRSLLDYERFGLPHKAGSRYFYTRNTGLQNQAQLFVRQGLNGAPRLLLDPNTWAADGATALDAWEPSHSGRQLAYSVQDGGSDWRLLRVLDVASGRPLTDEIRWAKFTGLAWVGDEGVLYSRFPAPAAGSDFQARNFDQSIWFHRPGTPQSADELVYATPEHPEYMHTAEVTSDGRYAVITSSIGTDARHEIQVIDLAQRGRDGWKARPLVAGFDHDWQLIDSIGERLWFVTNSQAPRYRLVTIDLSQPAAKWRVVVPEAAETLQRATLIGRKLVLNYLKDAASLALVVDLDGKRSARSISLRGLGTASGFRGKPGDPETFYSFTSFNRPASIYRLDIETGRTTPFAEAKLAFDPDDFTVEQRFYASKDGTRVPLFIVRKRAIADAKRAVPTLLYGYGGFDVSLTPAFSSARMAWLDAGGAFALANLRGGGEYGREWHDAGRLANKQNVFDDFIAAGEYLDRAGHHPQGRARDPGWLERRTADRRGGEPAARPVRRGERASGRDGHAALRSLHRGAVLGRRLRSSRPRGGLPRAAQLFALPQHPRRPRLSGDAGDHRRYRRPGRSGPQLQIRGGAPGRRRRAAAAADPDRDPRRARSGKAHRQADRGKRRHARVPRAVVGLARSRGGRIGGRGDDIGARHSPAM